MPHTLLVQSASNAIQRHGKRTTDETGGVLIGVPAPDGENDEAGPIVLTAGDPGEHAVQAATHFRGDPEADRRCLEWAREQFGSGLRIVGHWHQHPPGMKHCSGTDLAQAREIAQTFNDGQWVLVVILCPAPWRCMRRPTLHVYGLRHPSDELMPFEHEIVPDSDQRVQQAIRSAPHLPMPRPGGFWSDADFTFYQNPVDLARIREELGELRSDRWTVQARRNKHNEGLRLHVSLDDIDFELYLPREYPLAPPRLFTKTGELVQLSELMQWNSDRRLADVLRTALEVMKCRRCHAQHLKQEATQ